MKKKLISVFMAAVMVFGMAVTVSAAGNMQNYKINTTPAAPVAAPVTGLFRDVPVDAWYCESVLQAYDLGLVKGVDEDEFDPTGKITLAQTIALACRIHSMYYGGTGEFEQGDPWFQVYLDYALENGIIKGMLYMTDYSTAVVDRATFAMILAASMPKSALEKINDIDIEDLPDYASLGKESWEAVERLYRAGVLTGSDRFGTFDPNSNIRRCEVAAIVIRMVDPEQRQHFSIDKDPERITLQTRELFVDRTMNLYVPWEGNDVVNLICEYDTSMVEVKWKETTRKGAPIEITPLCNGQTVLTFYLEAAPEERFDVLLTISMAE